MNQGKGEGLVVPVNVVAFCVGKVDEEERDGTKDFAGATTDYTNLTPKSEDFLGCRVTRNLDESPLKHLEMGVHLQHESIFKAMHRI